MGEVRNGQPAFEDIVFAGVRELSVLYAKRDVSPVEVTRLTLERLRSINSRINAFSQVDEARALEEAAASEERWRRGAPLGALDGMPFSVKDTLAAKGFATRRGSPITSAEPAKESAPIVERVHEAGGVILGITTTPEFGGGVVTISPLSGITRNPWNPAKTSGGSSGGAAASIAAGVGTFALGTDAGGSIRIPAAINGVVGFKATGGLVPTYPANVAGGLSSPGPIARTVEDCATVLGVVARPDVRDPDGMPGLGKDPLDGLEDGIRGMRVAISETLGYARLVDEGVLARFREACAVLTELGAEVEAQDPLSEDPLPIYKRLFMPGFAYALRHLDEAGRQKIGEQLRRILEEGGKLTIEEYFDAHQARRDLAIRMSRFHQRYDLLITPAIATPAFDAELWQPPEFERFGEMRAWVPFGYPFNLTQQPAISIPCGFTDGGLPVGLQIIGPRFSDVAILRAARALEKAGISPRRRPAIRD